MNTFAIFNVYEKITLVTVCYLSCSETVRFECCQLTCCLIFITFRNKVIYHHPTLMSIHTVFYLTLSYHILRFPL